MVDAQDAQSKISVLRVRNNRFFAVEKYLGKERGVVRLPFLYKYIKIYFCLQSITFFIDLIISYVLYYKRDLRLTELYGLP